MDIKIICMDMDGTALRRDRVSFSPRLETALAKAHKRGIAIVPVTGRQYGLLPPAVTCHPVWENLAVLCNGAQVRRLGTGELLYSRDIPKDALGELLAVSEKYDLPVEFSMDSVLYLTEKSWRQQKPDGGLTFHLETILKNHGRVMDSLKPLCTSAVEKVNLMCIPDGIRENLLSDLQKIAVSAVWTSRNCMEITHPEADKGRGLEEVCRLLGIPAEAAMALGDSGNDIAMLRRAGLGVAMGSAPDFVKAAADAVSEPYDEDGAAKAIERYCL